MTDEIKNALRRIAELEELLAAEKQKSARRLGRNVELSTSMWEKVRERTQRIALLEDELTAVEARSARLRRMLDWWLARSSEHERAMFNQTFAEVTTVTVGPFAKEEE